MEKTNVMRLLDAAKIKYEMHEYDENETDGQKVAKLVGKEADCVFKTLVTVANTNEHYVFIVPVNMTLNLKKAAKVAGVKSVEMIKQKELLPLTGYVHGGCSPIGMKKPFKTFINETCILFDSICVSGGKLGRQIELSPNDLIEYAKITVEDIAD